MRGTWVHRKREGTSRWIEAIDVGREPSAPAGDHILRLFDAYDRVQARGATDWLLDEPFALVPGHRVDQTLTHTEGRYHSHRASVRVTPGLDIRAVIDPDALPTLFRCDGHRPLRDLLDHDRDLRDIVLPAARELLAAELLAFGPP